MCVDKECLFVDAEVFLSLDFNLDLSEPLFQSSPTLIEVIIDVLYAENYKLRESIPSQSCLEAMLPIYLLINFKCLHCFDVNNMDKLGDLIY